MEFFKLRKLLVQFLFVNFGFASISYAGLREDFSKSYTLDILTQGRKIDDFKNLPTKVQKILANAMDERANFDDVNFHKEVYAEDLLYTTVYKVISRGDVDLGNEDSYVLEVFDAKGKSVGGCYTKFNRPCELIVVEST